MTKLGYNPLNTIPRDITAKKVVYDKGDQYIPTIKSDKHCYSTIPLPIRPLENIPYMVKNDPNFKNFIGRIFGNLKVIGLFACDQFDKWVVRCCCGCYEIRTAKTLNKITGKIDQTRCQSCMDTERIRHKEYHKQHGIYPWQKKEKRCKF